MGKTDMQIIPAGKTCSLQRYNILIDKYCDFLAKNPKHNHPKLFYSSVSLIIQIRVQF